MAMRYLIGPMSRPMRLGLFAAVEAAGIVVQSLMPVAFLPGTAIMLAGLLLTFSQGYTNKPNDLGFEDWKPVTFEEVRRIHGNLSGTRGVRLPLLYRPAAKALLVVLVFVFAAIGFFAPWVGPGSGTGRYFIGLLNSFIILVPLFFGGTVKLWTPTELAMKLSAFEPVFTEDAAADIVTTPYIRFDKDSDGRQIPEDLRFMVELRRNPPDFVGVQFQVVINNGENGPVPYMYAVYLCKGKAVSFQRVSALSFGEMVTEPGGDDEYATLVVRQETSGTGYHTDEADCKRLYRMVVEGMRRIAK